MKPFEKYIKVEEERYLELLENEERRKQAINFINKNIEINYGALSNREELIVSKHDLIKNETDVLNCLIKILKGEENDKN